MTTMKETNIEDKSIIEWQKLAIANRDELIRFKQSRIDLLESAIREFLKADDELILGRADEELQKLRKLMENEK